MDLELKQYLDSMEIRSVERTTELKGSLEGQIIGLKRDLEGQIKVSEANTVRLITDLKESLERQISTGFEDIASRFDAQSIRLDRQAALLQTGSRWTSRMIAWAEKVDIALDKRSEDITELRRRLDKLDGGAK